MPNSKVVARLNAAFTKTFYVSKIHVQDYSTHDCDWSAAWFVSGHRRYGVTAQTAWKALSKLHALINATANIHVTHKFTITGRI